MFKNTSHDQFGNTIRVRFHTGVSHWIHTGITLVSHWYHTGTHLALHLLDMEPTVWRSQDTEKLQTCDCSSVTALASVGLSFSVGGQQKTNGIQYQIHVPSPSTLSAYSGHVLQLHTPLPTSTRKREDIAAGTATPCIQRKRTVGMPTPSR